MLDPVKGGEKPAFEVTEDDVVVRILDVSRCNGLRPLTNNIFCAHQLALMLCAVLVHYAGVDGRFSRASLPVGDHKGCSYAVGWCH